MPADDATQPSESLSLDRAATHLLEECRMVLPGIQALFGFQLIAVFNATFHDRLTAGEQRLHLAAIICVVIAIGIVMAPAAIHRRTPRNITERFVRVSSRLVSASLAPLALGTALDIYLVSRLILENRQVSLVIALLALGFFAAAWIGLPKRFGGRPEQVNRSP